MEIRETSLSFPVSRGSGPRTASATLVFPRQVLKGVAAIRGYQVGFAGEDHHVGLLQVKLSTEINANVLVVQGELGCRDWSGNWDDEYNGAIVVSVLAELASITAPAPRGDLQIMDLEINQAVQFFRAAEHLDAANVMPDNSMPLIGGKTTGLRFYVDHDASAGLPLARLTGELTVRSGGASITIAPLATILPRRASEIERSQAAHTLNFAIPAAWCRAQVEIACQTFDERNPGPRSAVFRRTLSFIDVNPLRVYGVGVHYTGAGLNLAAPGQADLLTTFDYTRSVWPTGDVLASGFTTLDFGDDLSGVAADGCGSGFNALLDQLRDIKGDTDDLVYGLLPAGTPLTGVGGCGGGGAGTGMVGDGVTAAHEAGHAVGRQHAPCDDTTRCDSPRNTDGDYPRYGNFKSDSIGEFGFDPLTNRVFDPAVASDFMGYSGNDWISPHTYRHLLNKGDPVAPSGSTRLRPFAFSFRAMVPAADGVHPASRPEWIRRRERLLHLSLWVDGAKVQLRPSFTFEAFLRRPGTNSDYEVHLLGKDDAVLACVGLQQACGACAGHCGPVQLLGEVPWNGDATKLVLRRKGHDIAEFEVEPQPAVKAHSEMSKDGQMLIKWCASAPDPALWYLVQWCDRDGTWRGMAPRTQQTQLVVPKWLRWATKDVLQLRVLAVLRLHTATADCQLDALPGEPPTDVVVHEVAGGSVVRATLVDPTGRTLVPDDLAWYDEAGGEVARGAEVRRDGHLRGVVTVRDVSQGIAATEGYAVMEAADGVGRCGHGPAGAASLRRRKPALGARNPDEPRDPRG